MRAYLDIETRKTRLVEPFVNPSFPDRQPFRNRWQVIMVGVAVGAGAISLFEIEDDSEESLLEKLEEWLNATGVTEIMYGATRSFDEAILRGTFLNARRELLDSPGPWPHLLAPDRFDWINVGPSKEPNPDGLSKEIPKLWESGRKPMVRKHCLVDVQSLQLADGALRLSKLI